MPDTTNVYRAAWSAKEYLRQYYVADTPETDDQRSLSLLAAWLRTGPRVRRALEVGCGPVPYRAVLFTPHADEIHLADFLDENLAEIRSWQEGWPGHHDWDNYLRGALAFESDEAAGDLNGRKAELRRKMTELRPCDLTRTDPLDLSRTYELVTSFYCAECISHAKPDWERYVANLTRLVAPGGRLFVAAIRNSTAYRVFDRSFPATSVNEDDWSRLLPTLGFLPEQTFIDVADVPDWADEGFDSMCVIRAVKDGPA